MGIDSMTLKQHARSLLTFQRFLRRISGNATHTQCGAQAAVPFFLAAHVHACRMRNVQLFPRPDKNTNKLYKTDNKNEMYTHFGLETHSETA